MSANPHMAGPAFTVRIHTADILMVAKALSDCAKGQVLVIDGQGELNTALWGELTTLAALRKGLAGVVIDGAVRDSAAIRRSLLPVFARAVVPNAGGAEYLGELNVTVQCGGQVVRPGDWVIGDEDGVVVVPAEQASSAHERARNRSSKRRRCSSSEIRKGADLGAFVADTGSHSSVNNRKCSFRSCEASREGSARREPVYPAWGRADLPDPLPLSFRNALRTIGPGAILLAASIGGGEWLVGPAVAVKHGIGLFWIATLAIVLQTIFNLEAIRYTLYTGEPIVAGFMRLRPSSRFWAAIYYDSQRCSTRHARSGRCFRDSHLRGLCRAAARSTRHDDAHLDHLPRHGRDGADIDVGWNRGTYARTRILGDDRNDLRLSVHSQRACSCPPNTGL